MRRFWVGRLSVATAAAMLLVAASATAQEFQGLQRVQTPQKKSGWAGFTDSMSSGFKKMGNAVTPKTPKKTAPDPTALDTPARPSPDLYLAVALSYEDAKSPGQAEAQYRKAMEIAPGNLPTILAYGRFLQRQERFAEAITLYQKAARQNPKDTSVLNCLGLCYAQNDMLEPAVSTFQTAIRIDPVKPVLRNNLAAILIDLGKNEEAFTHLRAVHNEATTYYNLGYLIQKRGNRVEAAGHFAMALRCNPNMHEAQQWLEYLHTPPEQPREAVLARRANPPRTDDRSLARRVESTPTRERNASPRPGGSSLQWPGERQWPDESRPDAGRSNVAPNTSNMAPPAGPDFNASSRVAASGGAGSPPNPPRMDLPPLPGPPILAGPPSPNGSSAAPSPRETVQLMPPAPPRRNFDTWQSPQTQPPQPGPIQPGPIHTAARPTHGADPSALPDPRTRWIPESTGQGGASAPTGVDPSLGLPPMPDAAGPPPTRSYGTADAQVVYPLPPVLDPPTLR